MGTIPVLFDHLLEAGYAHDLGKCTLDELRERRRVLEDAESAISFTRRLLHGRIDIVNSELQRRRSGQLGRDVAELVQDLPGILAGIPNTSSGAHSAGRGSRLVEAVPAGCVQRDLLALADRIVSPLAMTTLGCQSVSTSEDILIGLHSLEQELSSLRRDAHCRIAEVQAAVASHYGLKEHCETVASH